MNIAQNCGLGALLFFGAIVLAVVGNVVGVMAWRDRADTRARWQWVFDPSYLFHASNFRNPRHPARWAALAMLGGGAILLIVLAASLIAAQRAGAAGVCGLSF